MLKKRSKSGHTDITSRGKGVPTYLYHSVRREQDIGLGRNIKDISSKHIDKARKLWLEKFGLIILAIVIVVSLISILYLSNSSIVILQVSSSNDPVYTSYKSEVKATATKLLSSSILNSNKITVNTKKIEAVLQADYPMYSSVSITLPLLDHHAVIHLTPAQPTVELISSNGQYLLNQNGQVMEQSLNSDRVNIANLPKVQIVNQQASLGKQILTTQEIQFIQTVVYELAARGNKVTTMTIPQGTSELIVNLVGKSYYGKFNLNNSDPRQQAGSFLATQHYLQTQNITPGKYIDVRTDGRVYYQ
ncbi:MAG: cell division protein FtsQ/DivIB [Candidatus Saccharimonadales bacterium]